MHPFSPLEFASSVPVDSGMLSWMAGKAVGELATIAGTTAPGYLADYSGLAWREDGGVIEACMMAAGGHGGNLTNNQVQSIRLDVNSPAWQVRKAAGDATGWPTAGTTTPYFPADGTPAPRHTYWFHHWVPELNRYMMFGASGMGSGAADWARLDGFDPDTNLWDAAGTYANPTANSYASLRDTLTGNIWSINAQKYFNPNTQAWTTVAFTGSGAGLARSGAFDSTRNQFFGLYSGDNWSVGNSTIVACKMSTAGVRTDVTFNASAAYTQFQADAPSFLTVALTYDPDLDVFYFYNGHSGATRRIYVITPNSGTVWDMALMSVTGVTPPVSLGSGQGGVVSKFKYISAFKAIILVIAGASVHFVRTQ